MPNDLSTPTAPVLARVVEQLVASVRTVLEHPQPPAIGLRDLVRTASLLVPGSEHAGVTRVDLTGHTVIITPLTATDHYPMACDEVQQRHRDGPAVEAVRHQQVVLIDDVDGDRRWPEFRRAVVEETLIRSILSVPLVLDAATTGVLAIVAQRPNAFDARSLEIGRIAAAHVGLAWSIQRRSDQFHTALSGRDIIGQAKGILMKQFGITAEDAFKLLSTISQESNRKLIDIAHRVIDSEHPAPPDR